MHLYLSQNYTVFSGSFARKYKELLLLKKNKTKNTLIASCVHLFEAKDPYLWEGGEVKEYQAHYNPSGLEEIAW